MRSSARIAVATAVLAAASAGGSFASAASLAGHLDSRFGRGGRVVGKVVPGEANAATAIALQRDGRVLVGGYATATDGLTAGFVVRLRSNGRFDTTFGTRGVAMLNDVSRINAPRVFGDSEFPPNVGLRVLPLSDGRILALGSSLVRLTKDGRRDVGFGVGGRAQLPATFRPYDLNRGQDGSILVVGAEMLADRIAGVLVRLTPNGDLDATFGDDGVVTFPALSDPAGQALSTVSLRRATTLSDGRILVGALAHIPPNSSGTPGTDITVLSRLMPDGGLDATFGQGGQSAINVPLLAPSTMVIGPRGAAMGGFRCEGGIGLAGCPAYIASISANGQAMNAPSPFLLCSSCNQLGTVQSLPDGGLLLSQEGTFVGAGGGSAAYERLLIFNRFAANLKQIYAFALGEAGTSMPGETIGALSNGVQTGAVTLLQPDGKILVAGSAPTPSGAQGMFVARLLGLRAHVSIPRQRVGLRASSLTALVDCSQMFTCQGKAELAATGAPVPSRALALGSLRIAPGRRARITLRLTSTGRQAVHQLARAILSVRPVNGNPARAIVAFR